MADALSRKVDRAILRTESRIEGPKESGSGKGNRPAARIAEQVRNGMTRRGGSG